MSWGHFSDSSIFFPIAPVDFQSIRGGGEGRGEGSELFFRNFFFSRFLGAGTGEGDPETRGTSCAIPSWNVPKSIFRNRSRCKSVTKSRSRRKSVTKSGVLSVLLSLLVELCSSVRFGRAALRLKSEIDF